MRSERGFTLVELLVVIAVLGILVLIAIPWFVAYLDAAALRTDQANLRTLNTMSEFYRVLEGGYILEDSKLQERPAIELQKATLVAENYLTEPIEAKRQGQYFYWLFDDERNHGRWMYSLYQLAGSASAGLNFSTMTQEEFNDLGARFGQRGGSWSLVDGEGLRTTGNGADLMFLGNGQPEYTITTRFKLGDQTSSHYGGVGILFETVISGGSEGDNYRDTGYILQFDRHFGQIVIRPRSVNAQGNQHEGNPLVRVGPTGTSDSPIINDNIPGQSDAWWTTEKVVSIDVRKDSDNKPVLSVTITDVDTDDTIIVLENFSHGNINSVADPANNFTGFRAWNGVGAEFYEMTIE